MDADRRAFRGPQIIEQGDARERPEADRVDFDTGTAGTLD
jgi:hypothetical protein